MRTGLLVALVLLAAPAASQAASVKPPPRQLVLQGADMGGTYVRNPAQSGSSTLARAEYGDAPAIRRKLHRTWLGGYFVEFDGASQGRIVRSAADLFSTARLDDVRTAWGHDFAGQLKARRVTAPPTAPGRAGAVYLIGHTNTSSGAPVEVRTYLWQADRVIAVITVYSAPGGANDDTVATLAQAQDARIRQQLHDPLSPPMTV